VGFSIGETISALVLTQSESRGRQASSDSYISRINVQEFEYKHWMAPHLTSLQTQTKDISLRATYPMKILISVLTSNKPLGKTVRHCEHLIEELEQSLESAILAEPDEYEGIVFTLVDEDGEYFYEVPNDHGFYQVNIGYIKKVDILNSHDLLNYLANKLAYSIEKSLFEPEDKEILIDIVKSWSPSRVG
tara:strand:+ start:932 stop:1501 length:570 start_codon:yes stop_codon:yes gene_type:complete